MDKATLLKKSVLALERLAKKVGAKTVTPDGKRKTKLQLVNSIIMAERLGKKAPGRKTLAAKSTAAKTTSAKTKAAINAEIKKNRAEIKKLDALIKKLEQGIAKSKKRLA